jgi:glycerate kinase
MRVTVALDKFKGTFSSSQAAALIVRGLKKRQPHIRAHVHPLADGGEGTAQILAEHLGMETRTVACTDLLGRAINAPLYWNNSERVALIESATVLGSHLTTPTPETFLHSNSHGLGQLFLHALALRPKEIWVALGGTLTADAGWGFASACGLQARDQNGSLLTPSLANIRHISELSLAPGPLSVALETKVVLLCDVNAPAAPVFEVSLASFLAQKGARSDGIDEAVDLLLSYARSLKQLSSSTLNITDSFTAAAGGMALSISALLPNMATVSGAHHVAEFTNFASAVKDSDLLVCGEGRLDNQTLFGKTPTIVAEAALKSGVPLVGVFGSVVGEPESLRSKLNAERLFGLFQKTPENWRQLKKESESRLIEVGIEIAHRFFRG